MKLILIELSTFGIAMATDSAVTHMQTRTGLRSTIYPPWRCQPLDTSALMI